MAVAGGKRPAGDGGVPGAAGERQRCVSAHSSARAHSWVQSAATSTGPLRITVLSSLKPPVCGSASKARRVRRCRARRRARPKHAWTCTHAAERSSSEACCSCLRHAAAVGRAARIARIPEEPLPITAPARVASSIDGRRSCWKRAATLLLIAALAGALEATLRLPWGATRPITVHRERGREGAAGAVLLRHGAAAADVRMPAVAMLLLLLDSRGRDVWRAPRLGLCGDFV